MSENCQKNESPNDPRNKNVRMMTKTFNLNRKSISILTGSQPETVKSQKMGPFSKKI